MPDKSRFFKICEFYSTLFHELGHWTGHASRLNRSELVKGTLFNSKVYSQEELVAEMASVFVCSSLNISSDSSIRNSAAYIKNWLSFLKSNPKAFVIACQQGQKSADFILSKGQKP
jgi:antirestriction protein ArdC